MRGHVQCKTYTHKLAVSTCSEDGSDLHALANDPEIRRVEHNASDTLRDVLPSGGGAASSAYPAAVFVRLTADTLVISFATPSLQTWE